MINMKHLSLFIVLFLAALQISHAVEYTYTNNAAETPGGIRFTKEISYDYTILIFKSSTEFVTNVFQQNSIYSRKSIDSVTLLMETFNGVAVTDNNEIHLSANYIEKYSGDLVREIVGILYHEMTHVWQWKGKGQANGGLLEGLADYMRLQAGFAPAHWVLPGQGDRWDQGYDVTARFLDYCTSLDQNFIAKLNEKMRDRYSNDFFMEILGKSVDQLWIDYKIKFMN